VPGACFAGIGAGEGARIEQGLKVLVGDLHSRSNKTNGCRNGAGLSWKKFESWVRRPGSRPGFSGVRIVEMAKSLQRMLGLIKVKGRLINAPKTLSTWKGRFSPPAGGPAVAGAPRTAMYLGA
jgi:hypothetical protein